MQIFWLELFVVYHSINFSKMNKTHASESPLVSLVHDTLTHGNPCKVSDIEWVIIGIIIVNVFTFGVVGKKIGYFPGEIFLQRLNLHFTQRKQLYSRVGCIMVSKSSGANQYCLKISIWHAPLSLQSLFRY